MRLLPDPGRPYAALKADLVRLGWIWSGESQTLPLLPGEPEWVRYVHRAGGTLHYAYNPAIGLREIDADAPAPQLAELARLPQLAPADVAALVESAAVADLLLGLFAARALRLVSLRPQIRTLCTHSDELIRRTAEDVLRMLLVAVS